MTPFDHLKNLHTKKRLIKEKATHKQKYLNIKNDE